MGRVTIQDLDAVFTYQKPEPDQVEAFEKIKAASMNLARVILEECPESADTTHAIRVVRDARMWANAAVALRGRV